MNNEQRSFKTSFQSAGKTLTGYAAVFDSPTEITEGGRTFTETIRAGAFKRAVSSGGDIVATFNHDLNQLLGRTSSGTMRLSEDGRGLRFEIDLPETSTGNEVRELTSRGDLNGASFTFAVREGGEKWTGRSNRELTDLYLIELGPVVMPAYKATNVGLRSNDLLRLKLKAYEKWSLTR